MKPKPHAPLHLNLKIVALALLLTGGGASLLAQGPQDPMAQHLFPPELIQQTHRALGLTAEQEESLKRAFEQTRERIAPLEERMQEQTARMAGLVEGPRLDEEAVLDQADRVMRLEREVRQTQLRLLLKIKNTLTPEQQTKLREFKSRTTAIHEKLHTAKELAEYWKQEGRDLGGLESKRDEFEALMREGNVREAEELLDQTLRRLRESR